MLLGSWAFHRLIKQRDTNEWAWVSFHICLMCISRQSPSKPQEKKPVTNSLLLNQESYLIYETLTCIFFIVFQESKQISQISTESDIIIIFFFNNISIHAKVNQSISLRCLDCGFLISNWCTYVSKYKNPRRKVNRMWKFSLYSSFFLNLIISFLQFRGSWYLWVVLFSGFFFQLICLHSE